MSALQEEISRRRTFAIISHPDAGKTTLTEKFLLYGGAIAQAGAVKGKKNTRAAVSDWMEIEKQRGISVTSSVMQFQYDGFCINILDTPGHQDFSEDTYRTLMAADSAVMVIDGAKGVEPQTRKLFKVCAMRHIPIFTFINKMDREARDPFELLDELENELGIETYACNWPMGSGREFQGVYDRRSSQLIFFSGVSGKNRADKMEIDLYDPQVAQLIGERRHQQLIDDVELLGAGREFDLDEVRAGRLGTDELWRGTVSGRISAYDAEPAAARSRLRRDRHVQPRLFRVCVQNSGKHEQGPPRPSGLHAYLLRPVPARRRILSCPERQKNAPVAAAAAYGLRTRDRR